MVTTIDRFDASHSRLRLVLTCALASYDESVLFEFVLDQDIILRTVAARELHMRGTRTAFEFALKLANSLRFEEREIAAFLLGQLGVPNYPFAYESFGPLSILLADPYFEVRATAAGAIGFLAAGGRLLPEGYVEKVALVCSDSERSVREAVAYALGSIHLPAAKSCLLQLKDDAMPEVADAAEFALTIHAERDQNGNPNFNK